MSRTAMSGVLLLTHSAGFPSTLCAIQSYLLTYSINTLTALLYGKAVMYDQWHRHWGSGGSMNRGPRAPGAASKTWGNKI